MNKSSKKIKFAAAIAATAVLVGGVAYASIGKRNAELSYNNIKITLDSKEIVPKDADGNTVEPFVIDGTTYLPVRGISTALGLEVAWDNETKTVVLNTPGVFSGGVQVYDDKYVTIDFVSCTSEKPYSFSDTVYYYANFNIKNKTDVELTFQPDSLSFNGISYNTFSGSEHIAPQSTGKVKFYSLEPITISGINKTSGQISVIDFSDELFDFSYDAKWINVTQ